MEVTNGKGLIDRVMSVGRERTRRRRVYCGSG